MESSTKNYSLPVLFEAFSAIKLDIATGLQNQGWLPSPSDIEHMGEADYRAAIDEYNALEENVFFRNIDIRWNSDGDFNDFRYIEYITIESEGETYEAMVYDTDQLYISGPGGVSEFPVDRGPATVFDFIRACELCGIHLELSPAALKLIERVLN